MWPADMQLLRSTARRCNDEPLNLTVGVREHDATQ